MNLAQLIDPEWVQNGAHRRNAPLRPQQGEPAAAREASAPVVRCGRKVPKRKLQVLRWLLEEDGRSLTVAQLAQEIDVAASGASFLLSTLKSEGLIEVLPVNRGRRPFVYSITEAGRAFADAWAEAAA